MKRSFKTEIDPSEEQKEKIHQTLGVCRYVYNFYLSYNKKRLECGQSIISGKKFSVWLNNEYLPANPEKDWIKKVSSKSVKKSIEDANVAFKKYFEGSSGFPRYKKKSRADTKMYFVKTDAKATIWCDRHRIKIPTLGWVKLKEKGYIPITKSGLKIISGTVSMKAGRYYVSVLIEVPEKEKPVLSEEGIGIDLGIKEFAILSNGIVYKNINRTAKIKKLEKKLKREQKCLSRKYKNIKKGEVTQRINYDKQKLKVQKTFHRIECIRTDYIRKCIAEMVRTKPSYFVIEDLNVSGMMKNKYLSNAIGSQTFFEFRQNLKKKCDVYGIELRIADRFYPSSKICHDCGAIKKDITLSDRVYQCDCGYIADRDYNASLNLRDVKSYRIA